MKISDIKKLHLEDYYWRLVFGKSKYQSSFFELRGSGFKGLPAPVIFLSTGRCGTNWFTELLSLDASQKVFHEPRPNFGVQGKIAYEVYRKNDFHPTEIEKQLLEEIFLTGREQYLRYSYKTQRRFVETNNQITFLAPAIYSIFPDTKFVHLNRHPGEFVRSALRRKFYNNTDDIKRIVPIEMDPYYTKWKNFDRLEKNCWLWSETNNFIEQFKASIPPENTFYFNFSDLSIEQTQQLANFLSLKLNDNDIKKAMGTPVNVQKSGIVNTYDSWKDQEKASLKEHCGKLASKYNYQL